MRWKFNDGCGWEPVPFAWLPVAYGNITYWLEQPSWERKFKFAHIAGNFYEYRPCAS